MCLYYHAPGDIIEPHQVILLSVIDPILQKYMCKKTEYLYITSVSEIFLGCHLRKIIIVLDQDFQNWL